MSFRSYGGGDWNQNLTSQLIVLFSAEFPGQHGHLSGGLHPAHAHMHGGWYASGMGALGASGGLQGGFGSTGGLGGGVVSHSQSYHLAGLGSMVS